MEGGHLLQPDGVPLLLHLQPLPPQQALDQLGAPSLWPPSTLLTPGETLPHPLLRPSGLPGTSHHLWKPDQVAAFLFPSDFSVGVQWPAPPRGFHSQQNPSERDRLKKKSQIKGDKWRGARRGGAHSGLVRSFVTAPLLLRSGFNLVSERIKS